MKRISEQIKIDTAIWPAAVSSNGTTSQYFDLTGYGRALFVWTVVLASAGLTTTSVGTILEATDGNGTGAAALADSTAILTAGSYLVNISVTASATIAQGDTVSITEKNDFGEAKAVVTFTMTSSATASPTISHGININDGAGGGTAVYSTVCTSLANAINALDGTQLHASATASNIAIRSLDGGGTVFVFSASNTAGFSVLSSAVQGMIEIGAGALTVSSNYTHVALNVVNQSAYQTSAIVLRDAPARFLCHQQAAVFTQV